MSGNGTGGGDRAAGPGSLGAAGSAEDGRVKTGSAGAGESAAATNAGEHEDPLRDEYSPVELIAEEVLFTGHVWDVAGETFLYNGEPTYREVLRHPGAVAVLPMDDHGRVLLIQQYRHPVQFREWEIPAGLLDVDGESPLLGAKRELAEEVDLVASRWDTLLDYRTSPGGSTESLRIYLARGLSASSEAFERTDEEADLALRWVSLEDAVDAVLDRRIQNSTVIVALLAAQAARARNWSTLAGADAPWPLQRRRAGS